MGLSEQEKQILADLEQQFASSTAVTGEYDDHYVSMPEGERTGKLLSPRLLVALVICFFLGLVLALVGMSFGYGLVGISLGVAGILVMIFAVTLPVNPRIRKFFTPKK